MGMQGLDVKYESPFTLITHHHKTNEDSTMNHSPEGETASDIEIAGRTRDVSNPGPLIPALVSKFERLDALSGVEKQPSLPRQRAATVTLRNNDHLKKVSGVADGQRGGKSYILRQCLALTNDYKPHVEPEESHTGGFRD